MMAGRGFAPTFELQNQNSVWHVSKTEPKLDFEASNKKKSKKSNKFNFHAGTLPAHCKNRKHSQRFDLPQPAPIFEMFSRLSLAQN